MANRIEKEMTLHEYLALPYTVRVVPAQPSGYMASVEELSGCITQAETWAEAGEMIRDAMRGWISTALEDGEPVPEPHEDAPPAKVLLRLPRSLHQSLVRAAERDGVSLNQFLVYLLGRAIGERESSINVLPTVQHGYPDAWLPGGPVFSFVPPADIGVA